MYVGHCLCTCSYTECVVRSKMLKGTRSVYVGHYLCTCLYTECVVRSKVVKSTPSVRLRTGFLTLWNYSKLDEK